MTTTRTAAAKTTTTAAAAAERPEPPAMAVALDAHWAAKRAKLAERRNAQVRLRICDDEDLKAALAEAQYRKRMAAAVVAELDNDKDSGDRLASAREDLAAAETAVDEAQAAVDEATLVLTFRALPRPEFESLLEAHKPTEEQAEDNAEWNPDSFPAALVSAASLDGMPVEDAQTYLDTWGPAEARGLFDAAFNIQRKSRMDLGKG